MALLGGLSRGAGEEDTAMDAGLGGLFDAVDEPAEKPSEPACLPSTESRLRTDAEDTEMCGDEPCLFCLSADDQSGCTEQMAKVLALEPRWRSSMPPVQLYTVIAYQFNRVIVRRLMESGQKCREVTLSEVRRHYQQNHTRDPKRDLLDTFQYLGESARTLQRHSLFTKHPDKPGELQPDRANWDLYIKITVQQQQLAQRLGIHADTAPRQTSQRGGRAKKT